VLQRLHCDRHNPVSDEPFQTRLAPNRLAAKPPGCKQAGAQDQQRGSAAETMSEIPKEFQPREMHRSHEPRDRDIQLQKPPKHYDQRRGREENGEGRSQNRRGP
jgi:hypothetical protein